MDLDSATLLSTIVGGLVATVVAFAGSVWLEFWREGRNRDRERRDAEQRHIERRRLQTDAAKVVALELSTQAEPLRRFIASGSLFGDFGDRSAWDDLRPVLAGGLKIEGLLNVEAAYSALAEAKEALDHDVGVEILGRAEFEVARRLLSRIDGGRDQMLTMAAAFDTVEDLRTGRISGTL